MPLIRRDRIRDKADNLTGKTLRAIKVRQRKRNRIRRVRDDGPVPPVPALRATVQSVVVVVLVGVDVVISAIDVKGAVFDSIGIAPRHGTEMGMRSVGSIGGGVVKAEDHVTLDATAIIDEEVGYGCSVRNKVCTNALCRNG